MLFSATMPKRMNELAQAISPIPSGSRSPRQAVEKIDQSVHFVQRSDKTGLLKAHLDGHRGDAALVFARTKHGAERLMKSLVASGFAASSIHGNKARVSATARSGLPRRQLTVLVIHRRGRARIDIPRCATSTTTTCRTCPWLRAASAARHAPDAAAPPWPVRARECRNCARSGRS